MMRSAVIAMVLTGLMAGSALAADPDKLVIDPDYSSVDGLLDAFTKGSVTDQELHRLESLPGIQAMIEKAHEFDPEASDAYFESSLRAVLAHQELKPHEDPLNFSGLEQHLPEVRKLVQTLHQESRQFSRDVAERLAPYSPPGLDEHVVVHFTLGGGSDGWAPNGTDFYLSLNHLDGDYQGVVVLTSHEVYHLIQDRSMPESESGTASITQRNVDNLLIDTYREGTASVVGDPTDVKDGGDWIKWFSGKYASNTQHIADDYMLLDTMLYRAAHDPGVDYDRLYDLGFSGGLGSAAYFVGYDMAQVIMRYEGRAALPRYLSRPVRDFFTDYLDLCSRHGDDRQCLRFSKETESLMRGSGKAAQ